MFINKIKQNFAGFAAVAIAFAGFSAIAPANAVGTSVTTSQVGYTAVQRSNSTISANSMTVSATVGADETLTNLYADIQLAGTSNLFTAQAGDSLKVTGTYANVTDNSTASYMSTSCTNWSARLSSTPYTWTYGNGCNSTNGANNVVTKTTALTGLSAGTYDTLSFNQSFNLSDSSISVGDQLTFNVVVLLVRGGVETPLNIVTTNMGSNQIMMNFNKVGTLNHTTAASDSYLNFNANFCVFKGENGVTNSTQIDVTVANSGTGNNISYVSGDASIYGGMGSPITPTTSGNTRSYVLPASGWDVVRISAWSNVSTSDLTIGQTFTPVLTAVIHGTSTSVIDLCSRTVPGMAAPTATAGGTSVSLAWAAPTLPVSGNWDTIQVYACPTTLNTCGAFVPMGYGYMPNGTTTRSATLRVSSMISVNTTSLTVSASNMMNYMTGPGQTPASWSASDSLQYFVVYLDSDSPFYAVSALSTAVSANGAAPQQQVQNNSTPTVPTTVPLVAPIAVPATGFTPGGSLTLSGANMAKITEVKIGGTVAKTVASASGVAIDVPKDLAPGAYDLLITTPTGSTQFVGAIKVADPVVVAAKAAQAKAAASIAYRAPVDFTVGKTVTAAQAAAAKAFAAQYRNAKTALCLAIPASKSTVAAATAAAAKVCAGFKASIPGIKTSVVVTAPSGDKVNRVSAEIQG